jgi:hypothetical protein
MAKKILVHIILYFLRSTTFHAMIVLLHSAGRLSFLRICWLRKFRGVSVRPAGGRKGRAQAGNDENVRNSDVTNGLRLTTARARPKKRRARRAADLLAESALLPAQTPISTFNDANIFLAEISFGGKSASPLLWG